MAGPPSADKSAFLLESYPPFAAMDIRVLELDENWRKVRILLPLNKQNRNPGGSMFGGCIAALADPIPALACHRQFPAYTVWTRELQVDFRRPGLTDLELRFELTGTAVEAIAEELRRRDRSTPEFEFGFYDRHGALSAWVRNRVAIRTKGSHREELGAIPGSHFK